MKYIYSYKTSDKVRHEASVEAQSKEAVFERLRAEGVKPIKVWLDPVAERSRNVKIVTCVVLAAIIVLGLAVWGGRYWGAKERWVNDGLFASYSALPRSQSVSGVDPSAVFKRPADCYLAAFAVPGADVDVVLTDEILEDFFDALQSPVEIEEGDDPSVAELKRIVLGIKEDVLIQLASGKDYDEIFEFLDMRQKMEREFHERMTKECEKAKHFGNEVYKIKCDAANKSLKSMGLPLVNE